MIQPFGHFSSMCLSLCNYLFILQSTLFEDTPLHIHKNLHTSFLFSSNFALLTTLLNSLLTSHRLNQDLLLVILWPFSSQIHIKLNMIIFIASAFFHYFLPCIHFQFCKFSCCQNNCIFLAIQFIDPLIDQIAHLFCFILVLALFTGLFYSLGKLFFIHEQRLQVEGTTSIRTYLYEQTFRLPRILIVNALLYFSFASQILTVSFLRM